MNLELIGNSEDALPGSLNVDFTKAQGEEARPFTVAVYQRRVGPKDFGGIVPLNFTKPFPAIPIPFLTVYMPGVTDDAFVTRVTYINTDKIEFSIQRLNLARIVGQDNPGWGGNVIVNILLLIPTPPS